ncbi:hypothetical protein WA026_006000 [Henosepilachna vigintioctopunctata]|uniref:FYVE-type zinc finger domain-containing protein n=1 Tax=Henosepilachna vigintioctopunctata TaxID=420089 RepID=A0AAW1TWV4_9CUCU
MKFLQKDVAEVTEMSENLDRGPRALEGRVTKFTKKGSTEASADWDNTGPDPDRSCGRCRVELGRVINRGAYCRACRLRVCKSCREYSIRTTDWVCTVCHKRMEIQAASGEWMNEFVRRPSRRRDNRLYVPTAEIIKRTIRRSWTISNPTPRWSTPRNAPEMRPYNSLPRGQDITNYPSLQHQHQDAIPQPQQQIANSPSPKRHSPARRTHSEDVYPEREDVQYPRDHSNPPSDTTESSPSKSPISPPQRSPRINPLILYAQKDKTSRPRKKTPKAESFGEGGTSSLKNSKGDVADEVKTTTEKRVSFDSCARDMEEMPPRSPKHINTNLNRATSLTETPSRLPRRVAPFHAPRSLQERAATQVSSDELSSTTTRNSTSSPETSSSLGAGGGRDERDFVPLELCDIEPLSGTVFRKVTVRRRRQDMRKMAAVDSGWRRNDSDLLDVLAPEGDDYKLVFLSSDSSSKEEDVDDNDSSSTASSFPIDDCDWDYFEPGTVAKPVLTWSSPFGSPRVYRRSLIDSPIGSPLVYRKTTRESDTGTDDDYARIDTGSPASSDSLFASKRDSEEGTSEAQGDKGMEDVALQCKHKVEREIHPVPPCRSCGASTQYIPIPVPVPIPVPIPTLWTAQEALKFYGMQQQANEQTLGRLRIFPRNLWPFLNAAALSWPVMGGAGEPISVQPTQSSEYDSESEASRRTDAPDYEAFAMRENMNECNDNERKVELENVREENQPKSPQHVPEIEEPIYGYLESENRFDDSSSSSTETDDSEYNEQRKTCVTRVYNVNGRDGSRESDDALPSSNLSSCDEDDAQASPGSAREDMTSSCSADTDSDDTGTDQKSKRFSKVFVVNKNEDSSSEKHSSCSESDTSDNDTDTELDCTVVLQNIKYINQEDENAVEINGIEVESEVIESIDSINQNETKDNVEDDDNAINETEVQYKQHSEKLLENSELEKPKMTVCFNDSEEKTNVAAEKIEEYKHTATNSYTTPSDLDLGMPKERRVLNKNDCPSDKNVEPIEIISDESIIENYEALRIPGDTISEDIVTENWSENVLGINISDENDVKVIEDVPREVFIRKIDESSLGMFDIEKPGGTVTSSSDPGVEYQEKVEDLTEGHNSRVADPEDRQGTVSSERNVAPPSPRDDIRSVGSVSAVGESEISQASSPCSEAPGVSVTSEQTTDASVGRHAARYTSLVMITQESPAPSPYQQVSVVTSDTTTFVSDNDVIVQHTNWQKENGNGAKDPVTGECCLRSVCLRF